MDVTQQFQKTLAVQTGGRGLYEVSREIAQCVEESGIETGLCVIYCTHTSASLLIQENADPSAARDLLAWLQRLAPDGDPHYTHTAEGPDDMPAHLRSAVTRSSEAIPVASNRLSLGAWQGIYLVEHRLESHHRRLIVHIIGG